MNSSNSGDYCLRDPSFILSNGILEGDMPLNFFFTRAAFQLVLFSVLSLMMQYLLKPLGQTRYISNLVAALILGPSFIGGVAPEFVKKYVFPAEGMQVMDMAGRLGVCFWYFLMGAQIHLGPMMRNATKKSVYIGMVSMASPLLLSYASYFAVNVNLSKRLQYQVSPFFLGMYFITTTLSVMAGNVIDHKLLGTEMGNLAMTSGIFVAIATIFPLNMMIWVIPPHDKPFQPQWKLCSAAGYYGFIFLVARPVVIWISRRTLREEDVKEHHVCGVLLWSMASALITETLGAHPTTGAFFAGIILPHSPLTTMVTSRLEDFNNTLLMPPFFVLIGSQIDLLNMFSSSKGWPFVLVLLVIYLGKVGLIGLTASWYGVPLNEGFSIGFLLCSRGILDILLVYWATKSKLNKADDQEFAIMMFGIMVTNLVISPAISFFYDHPQLLRHKGSRAIQELKPDTEFRILGCIYDQQTIPSLLNLIKSSHATRYSPICLSILHLVHATSRESTVQQQSMETGGFMKGEGATSVKATFNKHNLAGWVSISHHTQLSSYSTMPEHICNAAEAGRATFLIIPFHIVKMVGTHGGVSNDPIRTINQQVLQEAPCSVGVLVDQGVDGTRAANTFHNVAVLFFGGPHDREALTYAARMVQHEPVRLTVVRFTTASPAATSYVNEDDICIQRFKMLSDSNRSISFMEQQVESGADTVSAIHGIGNMFDLFIVGRQHGPSVSAQMMSGLEAWSEYPELGTVGDLLASSDFKASAILAVQQYSWAEDYEEAENESRYHAVHAQDVPLYERQGRRHLVQEDQMSQAAYLRARRNNATRQKGVQFDEYGWNWNLGAGF
ncbi:unnamed protein product [Victoria cruziana]